MMKKIPTMIEKLKEEIKEIKQGVDMVKRSEQIKKCLKATLYVIDLLNEKEEESEKEQEERKKETISVIGLSEKIINVKTFDGTYC